MLQLSERELQPSQIVLGAIWLELGDGMRLDPGQSNANETVAAAIRLGIREFDTAPWYGAGASEERIGRAIAALPNGERERVRLGTKAGRVYAEADGSDATSSFEQEDGSLMALRARVCRNDYTAAGARLSLAHSLARMGDLKRVYGLRIHDPNDNSLNKAGVPDFVDEVAIATGPGGMISALRALREEGAVDQIGLGMNCNREAHQGVPEEVVRLIDCAPDGTFNSALLAGGWNLLSQEGLPCLQRCQLAGIEVHVAGIFGSGLLVGGDTYAYCKAPQHAVERTSQWAALASKYGLSLPAVAIAFAALPACVTRVVIGMASPAQVEQALEWVSESHRVSFKIWQEAKRVGLLDEAFPLP